MAIETHQITKACLSKAREHTTSKCPDCGELKCLCRPRFFAGQLLTEEDLNLLDRYIIEKNKLHNRQLHGWGVVNGLEVACHPCDPKVVTVHSGYAIDPCGNDIVVCEDDEVPICELIDECKDKERSDDPCKPYKKKSECKEEEEHWVLALRYDEKPSRGVGALRREYIEQCEPRTVCETYRYEVYKSPDSDHENDREWWSTMKNSELFQRISACMKKLTPLMDKFKIPTKQYYLKDTAEAGSNAVQVTTTGDLQAGEGYHALLGNEDNREYLTVESVNANVITFKQSLASKHIKGEPVIVYDSQALYTFCCQLKSIIEELMRETKVTNCRDIYELQCIECPYPSLSPESFNKNFLSALAEMLNIVVRLMVNCICFSLLPETTRASQDNRVPLAVISVNAEECRVLKVCNWTIHRKFLVTMPNLYYWLHPLLLLVWSLLTRAQRKKGTPRELLESACCSAFEMFNFPQAEKQKKESMTKTAYKAVSVGALDSKLIARNLMGITDLKGRKVMEAADMEHVLPFMLFNRLGSPVYKAVEANMLSGMKGEVFSSLVSSLGRISPLSPREDVEGVTEMRTKVSEMERKMSLQEKTIKELEKKIKKLSG